MSTNVISTKNSVYLNCCYFWNPAGPKQQYISSENSPQDSQTVSASWGEIPVIKVVIVIGHDYHSLSKAPTYYVW